MVTLLLNGCASAPIQVNAPDETEHQRKLDRDPRFQRLMDQITAPVGDSWHFTVNAGRSHTGKKAGYYIEGMAKRTW